MPRVSVDEAIRRVAVEGWCVLDSVIPPGDVDGVREAVLEVSRHERDADKPRIGIGGLIAKTQAFAPYVAEERLLGVAHARLGTPVRISMTHGIVTAPGYGRANWHGDWPFSLRQDQKVRHPYPIDAPMHITTLWALTEFSAATGGTAIVPGSHRFGNNPSGDNGYHEHRPVPSELQPHMDPGDVLMIDSRVWHTNGDNVSDHTRVGMAARYAPWWYNIHVLTAGIRQYEQAAAERGLRADDVIPITPEQYEALPDPVKPLLRHVVIGQKVPGGMSGAEVAHTVGAEEALRRVRTEGWCVIDGVIPQHELAAVRDSVSATLGGRSALRGVIACDRSFAPYLVDERLTAIAEGMFGPESRIAVTDAFAAEPGAAGGGWHADWPYSGDDSYRVAVPYGDLTMAVTTLWRLTR